MNDRQRRLAWTAGVWFGSLFVVAVLMQSVGFENLGGFAWLVVFASWALFHGIRWAVRADRVERTSAAFHDMIRDIGEVR
jgi:hypothetical protein